jgi:hypothetical protein
MKGLAQRTKNDWLSRHTGSPLRLKTAGSTGGPGEFPLVAEGHSRLKRKRICFFSKENGTIRERKSKSLHFERIIGGFGGPPPINKKTKQYTRAQITRNQAYQSIACYNCTQIHNNCVQFGTSDVLLLVICNSVKMGIHLCYKWVPAQING